MRHGGRKWEFNYNRRRFSVYCGMKSEICLGTVERSALVLNLL